MDANPEELKFHIRLKMAREGRGLTIEQLAARSGLDRTGISKLENGKAVPALETIFKLCRGLNKRPGELLDAAFAEWCKEHKQK